MYCREPYRQDGADRLCTLTEVTVLNENNKAVRFKDLSATCILRMLLRNWWMIILSALTVSMATSLFLQYTYVQRYRASMTYAVTARKSSAVTNTNVTVTKEVAEVLAELLETDVINNKVRDSSESLAAFGGTFSASQVSGSNFINVSCTDVTPKSAFTALDKLTELFPEIADYISKNTVLQIIKNPAVSSNPINAIDVSRYEKLGAVGGAVLMIGLLVLMNIKRETVQTVSGAKHLVDASIIAVLGHERKVRTFRDLTRHKKTSVLITAPTVTSRYSEQVNTICSKLEHEHNEHGSRIFIVTGVGEDEGKSTVSANVALMLALKGKKVALVDGDFRKPAMNKIFDGAYKSQLPLNHMLKQPFSKENFLACIVRNPDNGLYMCFSDAADREISAKLKSDVMRRFLRQLCVFDFVIIDTPPMGFFTDAEVFSELADASVIVVRQDSTPACDVNDAVDILKDSKSKFLGVVLNDMRGDLADGYGYGYGYGSSRKKSTRRRQAEDEVKGGEENGN